MGTLETAGGPPQSPQLPLPPHIPEQSWQEPPPPFLRSIFNQSSSFSENKGHGTLTYGTTYSPQADISDALNVTTMDPTALNPLSSASSALLHPSFSTDLTGNTHGYHPPFPTTASTMRPADSRGLNDFTGTTTTNHTHTPTPTKTTEKEFTDPLHINTHGTTPITTQHHPAFDSRNQKETQSPGVKPRRPLFVRVIRNSPTTEKQFHSPSQSATTPTTHSMPTIVPNADHGSEAQPHRPRLFVRIRRNLPTEKPNTHPSSLGPHTDHLAPCTSARRTTPTTSSSNLCSNTGRSNGARRIVLVCRKEGGPTYPKLSRHQQDTTTTDRHHLSRNRPSTAVAHNMVPNATATSGPQRATQIIPAANYCHSHSNTNDNHNSHSNTADNPSITCTESISSAFNILAEYPAIPVPSIKSSTTALNRSSGSMIFAEVSSRTMTYRRFIHSNSVQVAPESIWHHSIRSHRIYPQNSQDRREGLRNRSGIDVTIPTSTRTRPNSPTPKPVATHDHHHTIPHQCSPYQRSLHEDDYTAILTGIPWYRPVLQQPHQENYHVRPGLSCQSTLPPSRPNAHTKQYWHHLRHSFLSYRFDHRRFRLPSLHRTLSSYCVVLPTSLTEDKNLLRPP